MTLKLEAKNTEIETWLNAVSRKVVGEFKTLHIIKIDLFEKHLYPNQLAHKNQAKSLVSLKKESFHCSVQTRNTV
jgi:hypothetical protein